MDIMIYTSDSAAVDPKAVYDLLEPHYFIASVDVNDGERVYNNPVVLS